MFKYFYLEIKTTSDWLKKKRHIYIYESFINVHIIRSMRFIETYDVNMINLCPLGNLYEF